MEQKVWAALDIFLCSSAPLTLGITLPSPHFIDSKFYISGDIVLGYI